MKRTHPAFTLIELLIVVAIIAILAAIAVPNFLEAQVRSKVSRCRADVRSIATALESYAVDNNNQYPPMFDYLAPGGLWPTTIWPPFHSRIPSHLTTPIAYMTSLPLDPFSKAEDSTPGMPEEIDQRFRYWNYDYFDDAGFSSATYREGREAAGKYLFYSVGPDRDQGNLGNSFYIDYDPTNGTVSIGNIFRTQRNPEKVGIR